MPKMSECFAGINYICIAIYDLYMLFCNVSLLISALQIRCTTYARGQNERASVYHFTKCRAGENGS